MISPIKKTFAPKRKVYDEIFFEDALSLFLGLESGHVGKYIYEDSTPPKENKTSHDYLWHNVIKQENPSYYMPKADNELLEQALLSIAALIPNKTPIVDFGIGGTTAFDAHIRPFLKKLSSSSYTGIDFCKDYLKAIKSISDAPDLPKMQILEMDFFNPQRTNISLEPSLGIMTCGTIGNIYGSLRDKAVNVNLVRSLKKVSSLTKNGWLLLSLDTNQEKESLMQGYATQLMSQLFLTVFHRINKELPVQGFDPSLFKYVPEWRPEIQLFAHVAEATESQDFTLGNYQVHIERGEKFHLLNSYKFKQNFFEACCDKANLDILNVWHHTSPMKLYLLKDRANPHFAYKVKSVKCPALLSALASVDTGNTALDEQLT